MTSPETPPESVRLTPFGAGGWAIHDKDSRLRMRVVQSDKETDITVDSLSEILIDPTEAIRDMRQTRCLGATATTVWLAGGGVINLSVTDTGQLLDLHGEGLTLSFRTDHVLVVRSVRPEDLHNAAVDQPPSFKPSA